MDLEGPSIGGGGGVVGSLVSEKGHFLKIHGGGGGGGVPNVTCRF